MNDAKKTSREPGRIAVAKTWKLFIGGAFPRSESGRSTRVVGPGGDFETNVCLASRKDLRNAVEAAESARSGWQNRTGYNRGQILHRIAEMAECRHREIVDAIIATGSVTRRVAAEEADRSIDRLVSHAGWTDKVEQVLGCRNSVAGPYHNMSIPEPIGVVGVVAPDQPSLLGLVSMIGSAIATGNVVVAVVSESNPLPGLLLGELFATSDVPAGVVNLLSGSRKELLPHLSTHRGLGAVVAAGLTRAQRRALQEGGVDSLTRVHPAMDDHPFDGTDFWTTPRALMPFVETKTIWHPIGG